ncbi:hypothetical protein Tco_1461542, partial [Tanacetum coccineum]
IQIRESEEESWTFSQGEDEEENEEHDSDDDNDDNDDEDNDQENDSKRIESDDSGDEFVHPTLYRLDSKSKCSNFTPSSDTTIPQPPIPIIQPQQQTHDSTTTTTIPTTTLPEIPNFASLFGFDRRVSSLEIELSELKQTNQFAEAVASISGIVDNYLTSKMKDEVNVALQLKSNKLREEAQAENQDLLNSIDSNMKKIIKEKVKAQTSKIMSKVKKYVTETLGAEVLVRSTNQPPTSYAVASLLSKLELKKILMDKMEENKSIDRSESLFQEDMMMQTRMKNPLLDQTEGQREGDQARKLKASGTTSSFNEFLATPIDFSAFIMNTLNIQNLTQDLLTGPTYDLIKGTCKSVVELEYHLEEVFKAINDQLDCHNPEGRPYLHDLSKPLPLILDARGRQIIPHDHFINNDLEYLKGGSLSRKYTTSITKTKAVDYGHVK